MKFTHAWLLDHLDSTLSVKELSEMLTRIGLEVEDVSNPADPIKDITVGEILEAEKHPNADRLQICTVAVGMSRLQVVCGAPNARKGIKVAVALPGTVIPATGETLKKGVVRSIESQAMMCSTRELCLGDEHDGIIEVPCDAVVGSPYADCLGMNDSVFHINVTPNRGDCFGVRGVARDLAAAGAGTLKPLPVIDVRGTFDSPIQPTRAFAPDESHRCPYFVGRYFRGVSNKQSPQWMQNRMKACGIKVISALVDVTNYLAFDLGQPTHVFNASALNGNITVRQGRDGESLEALDDMTYPVEGHTIIADDTHPISLAGIMGGKETGCYDDTSNVFIESAFFDPVATARAGRALNIPSDARTRFERGVDPAMTHYTISRATQMILDHCEGEVSHIVTSGASPSTRTSLLLPFDRVKTHTGVSIDEAEQERILQALDFHTQVTSEGLRVQVPTWRHDVSLPVDLVEEILRIHGYDNIPATPLPGVQCQRQGESQVFSSDMMRLRRKMVDAGFYEQITWSFLSEAEHALFAQSDSDLIIKNPISSELSVMRPGLLPNLLRIVSQNIRRGRHNHRVFEVGAVFGSHYPDRQALQVAGAICGKKSSGNWDDQSPDPVSVFDAKRALLNLIGEYGLDPTKLQIESSDGAYFHPGRCGCVKLGPKVTLGVFGEIHPTIATFYDIKEPIVGFALFVDALPRVRDSLPKPYIVSNMQPVHRDFAFLLRTNVAAGDLMNTVRRVNKDLISDVGVFDVYEGEKIPEGKKSLALTITMQANDKTLTDADIQELSSQIISAVAKKHEGVLRDG